MAAGQGAAVALSRRPDPLRTATGDRHQPGEPELHPRSAPRKQLGGVPAQLRVRRLHDRLGHPGRARGRQHVRNIRRRVSAARDRCGHPRDRREGGHDGRLLPRRRARVPVRERPPGCAGPQPRAAGDAGGLQRDGADGRGPRGGPARCRRSHRRDRERARRRALQRLLHDGADHGGGPERDPAGEPLERRVRQGASRPSPSGPATRCRSRGRRSARWSTS